MTTAARPESATPTPTPPDASSTMRWAPLSVSIDHEAIATRDANNATRAAVDRETRIPLTFSSDHPVQRYNYWEDERYLEILDHSPNAIDLSRAVRGLPFFDTHDTGTVAKLLGRVEDIYLRSDGRLAGWLRLSRKQIAQDYGQDIEDRIAGEVSVGYMIDPTRVDRITKDGELPRYILRRWTPHEVSGVGVPADPTVGLNRELPSPWRATAPTSSRADADVSARAPRSTSETRSAPTGQEAPMEQESTAPDTGGTTTTDVRVTRSESPNDDARRKLLAAEAQKHGVTEVFARGLADNRPLDEIGAAMMQALRERADKGPQFGAPVTLTEKEQQRYSIAKAILGAGQRGNSFEKEVSETIARNLPQGYNAKGSGLFVPTNLANIPGEAQRAAMVVGTSSMGGALTFTVPGSFIDLLRNQTVLLRAGATLLPGLRSSVSFPRQTGTGTWYWVGENPGSDVTESNATFDLVSLTPKTGSATEAFSRQLLIQAEFVPEIEQMVRNDLAAIAARGIDLAGISGSGSSNQPLGLLTSTNVATIALGANGAVPTYDHLVDMESALYGGNVSGLMAYLSTPGIAGKLKKTQRFATTNGEAVWTGGIMEGTANGARAFGSNQLPSNLTKGTSTTICHAIIAGVFPHLMVGEFGALEIITDEVSKKKQGLIEATAFAMVDVAWRYDAAFRKTLDAKIS